MRPATLLLGTTLILAGATIGTTSASAAAADSPPPRAEMASLTSILDEAESPPLMPEELDGLAGRVAWIADEYSDIFGDVSYDEKSGSVQIGVKGGYVEKALALLPSSEKLSVFVQPYSHLELMTMVDELRRADAFLAENLLMASTNPLNGGLSITVGRQPTDEERAELDTQLRVDTTLIVSKESAPVLGEDRLHDDTPFDGGMRFGVDEPGGGSSVDGKCTAAFGYHLGGDDFMLTAGHCFKRTTDKTEMWTISGGTSSWSKDVHAAHFGGRSSMTTYGTVPLSDGQHHGDVSLVDVTAQNKATSHKIWVGGVSTSNRMPVVDRTAPFLGQQNVCRNGQTTGQYCGLTVYGVSGVTYVDQWPLVVGYVYDIDFAYGYSTEGDGDCGLSGDSGGPVFKKVGPNNDEIRAIGVYSGSAYYVEPIPSIKCLVTFTSVQEAVQAWSGDLNTR